MYVLPQLFDLQILKSEIVIARISSFHRVGLPESTSLKLGVRTPLAISYISF